MIRLVIVAMVAVFMTRTTSHAADTDANAKPPVADKPSSPSAKKPKNNYPWKTGIVTTMFYIGEDASKSSAWDENWVKSNHGKDSPDDRNGYSTGSHASTINPFYVALPFNDLAHPDKAKIYVPSSWQLPAKDGKPVSACQHRWVEIKSEDEVGRVCYAQWEDVGPNGDNHAEYVFGSERPDKGGAGLDVSPAVAQYLGLNNQTQLGHTRWRFVDAEDIPPGAWLKLDEEAILYSAMHHGSAGATSTEKTQASDH